MTKTFLVDGMSCEHCEAHLKEEFEQLDCVESATANKDTKEVVLTLKSDIYENIAKKIVEDSGFKFNGTKK